MAEIEVLKDRCNLCGACIAACPFSLIRRQEDALEIMPGCTFCGACVDGCPRDAIVIREQKKLVVLDTFRGVWVFAEQRNGELMSATFELLGVGRTLADELDAELSVVLVGDNLDDHVAQLRGYPIDRIYAASHELLVGYDTLFYTDVLAGLVNKYKPEILLLAGTAVGRDLGPRLAIRVGAGLTADCTSLQIDKESGNLVQQRPAFGGNIMANIVTPYHRPQMATVRPKVMKPMKPGRPMRQVEVEKVPVWLDSADRVVTVINHIQEESNVQDLQEADIIVSGGRGLGAPENFVLIEELAELLGGAVGASRAVVDAGWLPSYHQVGQTGKTVQPKLYIACGISGAIQHQVGMRASDIIIAVNKDPEAPIFNIATFGVVENVHKFLPALIKKLRAVSTGTD